MTELDDLYWHSELPVAEVAARCGVPAARLHARVTPLLTDLPCYRCGEPAAYTCRTQREDGRPRCQACRATRADPARAHSVRGRHTVASLVGGVIAMVDGGDDIGWDVDSCVDALAGIGLAWGGDLVLVAASASGSAQELVRALGERQAGVLAVPSLVDLGGTQAERLQTLFTLTRMRWRVLSVASVHMHWPGEAISTGDLDVLDDEGRYPGERGFVSRFIDATADVHGWVS